MQYPMQCIENSSTKPLYSTQISAMNISVISISIHGLIIDGIDVRWVEKMRFQQIFAYLFILMGDLW